MHDNDHEELIFENLPMRMHLGSPDSPVVGHARGFRDKESNQLSIEIDFDKTGSESFWLMVDVVRLEAFGFTGSPVTDHIQWKDRTPTWAKWGVNFFLAYDGGGSEWTQFYRTKFGARFSMFWNKNIASWGGTTNLFPIIKKGK